MYQLKGLYCEGASVASADRLRAATGPSLGCHTTIYNLIRVGKVRMYLDRRRGWAGHRYSDLLASMKVLHINLLA